jgi:Kef-type K+ transport system membrane component KefB
MQLTALGAGSSYRVHYAHRGIRHAYNAARFQRTGAPINLLSPLNLTLALCLGLAAAAFYLGLAPVIGVFSAGIIAGEIRQRETLDKQLSPIMALIVPFSFVVTRAKVDLGALNRASAIIALTVVTLLAIAGKLIGCGLGVLPLGRKRALIVGIGMVPRREVGIIVASLWQQMGVFGIRRMRSPSPCH